MNYEGSNGFKRWKIEENKCALWRFFKSTSEHRYLHSKMIYSKYIKHIP